MPLITNSRFLEGLHALKKVKVISSRYLGTIHLGRWQIFMIFDTHPLPSTVFTTIRWQIWQIFYPCPHKKCRRLKLMVPYLDFNQITGNFLVKSRLVE